MGKNYKPAKPGSKDYPEKEAYKKAKTSIDREHIRPFILNSNKYTWPKKRLA